MAGLHKHKWSYTVKYAPDHFGSNKWHPPNQVKVDRWVNLYQIESLAGTGGEVDLVSLGYDKLLGQGTLHTALKVKARRASQSAVEKIKAAGGSIDVLELPEKPEEKAPAKKDSKHPTDAPKKARSEKSVQK
jgi:large subunit ribosomal protein L15